ncbi:MAG: hypothetical protein CMD02_07915 [Flavobacteriales bacterium]|nr:hypothetical protein [Flavobacteriales bacterium]|tara:strand:- start:316 stop:690 length:375 start_codon:yes stop_codon:yes gene_type:complete
MKKIKKIIFSALIIGILFFFYISMPSTNYLLTTSEKSFSSTSQFEVIQSEYIGKVIDIKGVITDLTLGSPYISVVLDSNLYFSFESKKTQDEFSISDTLTIKGRFEGYDDLFYQYTFTDCSILK